MIHARTTGTTAANTGAEDNDKVFIFGFGCFDRAGNLLACFYFLPIYLNDGPPTLDTCMHVYVYACCAYVRMVVYVFVHSFGVYTDRTGSTVQPSIPPAHINKRI